MPLTRRALCLLLAVAGPAAADVTVYAAGDIADCRRVAPAYSRAAATAELVAAGLANDPAAAVLTLGDNVYERGTAQEFASCYAPTWGRFKQRTYPSPGNHEHATSGASGYFGYFGTAAGPGHYAFTLGSWRLISLDSSVSGAARARQLAWLKQELEQHPSHCTLAYWHHPLYSSGGHPHNTVMQEAWRLLYRAGAELVLSGHDHDYERFAPQDADGRVDRARGIRQFVVGTGGAYSTPFLFSQPNSEMRDGDRTGVLKLVLGEQGYTWEFLEASYDGFPNGQAPDRGAGPCH